MAKTAVMKKGSKQRIPEFDFAGFMEDLNSPHEEVILGAIQGILEANRYQQQTAIELTKLIVSKNGSERMSEDEILSTFKRASQTVFETSSIQELFEKIRE